MLGFRWPPRQTKGPEGGRPPAPVVRSLRESRPLGGLALDDLALSTVAGVDRPRLLRLRHLADEIDVQETVGQLGADDLDVVGELEPALERARSDAAIEVLLLLGRLLLLARDEQRIRLLRDRQ